MKKKILLFVLVLIVLCGLSVNTALAENIINIECESNKLVIQSLSAELNNTLEGFSDYTNNILLLRSNVLLEYGNNNAIKTKLNELLVTVSNFNGDLTVGDRNKISNKILDIQDNLDSVVGLLNDNVEDDLSEAASYYSNSGISKVINKGLGFIVIAIILLIAFSILLDISYITIALVQVFFGKISKDGKPLLITKLAYRIVIEDNENNSKKVLILTYFRKQIIPLAILIICIGIYLRGQIFFIITKLQYLLSGLS